MIKYLRIYKDQINARANNRTSKIHSLKKSNEKSETDLEHHQIYKKICNLKKKYKKPFYNSSK